MKRRMCALQIPTKPGHAFQFESRYEAGHPFRLEAGQRSDLISSTERLLPRIEEMMSRANARPR